MKNKKLTIVGISTLVAGIMIFVGGFAMMGFDYKNLSTEQPYNEKTYELDTKIQGINLNDKNVDVSLSPSVDGKIRVNYYENEKNCYDIREENGTLIIDKNVSVNLLDMFFNISFFKPTISLEVPANFDGDISLKSSNANIKVNNVRAKSGTFTTSNNKINVEDCSFSQAITGESSNGTIEIQRVDVKGKIYCRTSNSKVVLNNISCQSLEGITNNGYLELEEAAVQEDISLKTSNNKIELDDISFGTSINCETSNGHIEGSINGDMSDFSFDCKTSNGNCNLPENLGTGAKKVRLCTSNSNIEVEIK